MSRRTTIPVPTQEQVKKIAEKMGYKCSDSELDEYRGKYFVNIIYLLSDICFMTTYNNVNLFITNHDRTNISIEM